MSDLERRILQYPADAPRDLLQRIAIEASRAVDLERSIAERERSTDLLRTELNELRFNLLPSLMAEASLISFRLADNSTVKVEDYVQGSLPKDAANRATAIGVLQQHGGEALIRSQVVADFAKKEHNRAITILRELQDRGLDARLQEDVHHSTLQAFVREKMRHGEELPYEKLGIFVGRRATVKPANDE